MSRHEMESGADFVLDSRSLIVGFLLLMLVCGAFFVIGFMEGKRQGLQARVDSLPAFPSPADAPIFAAQEARIPAVDKPAAEQDERAVTEQLDWYRNMSQQEGGSAQGKQPASVPKPPVAAPAAASFEKAAVKESVKARVAEPVAKAGARETAGVTYSVQVGAFRQRREAEVMAERLKAKGYTGFIEPPAAGSEFFLLKVGRFDSRADAVAMQLRLKKDGINSFVKSN